MLDELVTAAHTLARQGLVTAFGHVSVRTGDTVTITPPADLATVTVGDLRHLDIGTEALPAGVPPETWAHLEIYRSRPNVTAIARAMPPAAFPAAATADRIPALHGQAAWLGTTIPVHRPAQLLRTRQLAQAAASALGPGSALLLRGNGALTVDTSPGLAVTRMWLVEVACDTWLRAAAAGTPHALSEDEVLAWQGTAASLLPRLWQNLAR
ncbi:class II aldolase/adducin family protein [Dactylosporangium sp. CA-092794]|uniref:class II aldolase/adducin family protein n=1 Tax=Dactylosporangium sp. CA-092794 TaxID=3239929 RepID=UPI003D903B00